MICCIASRIAASSPAALATCGARSNATAATRATATRRARVSKRKVTRQRYRNSPGPGQISSPSVRCYVSVATATTAAATEAARGAFRDSAHVAIETDRNFLGGHRRVREHSTLVRGDLHASGREREQTHDEESEVRTAH